MSSLIFVTAAPECSVAPASRAAWRMAPDTAPHATDGNIPVSRSSPNHVVEEALVCVEVRVVVGSESSDETVGQDDSAHDIVAESIFDHIADGCFDEAVP